MALVPVFVPQSSAQELSVRDPGVSLSDLLSSFTAQMGDFQVLDRHELPLAPKLREIEGKVGLQFNNH